jgi:hypothetical protein
MSASNYNWVCFSCRSSLRQPKTARTIPKCLECGADLYCLGYKVELPRKLDVRGWRKLRADCRERLWAWSDREAVQRVRAIHMAEREIRRQVRRKVGKKLAAKARA